VLWKQLLIVVRMRVETNEKMKMEKVTSIDWFSRGMYSFGIVILVTISTYEKAT
jgi:hypothetical protein